MPQALRLQGRVVKVVSPLEIGPALDFINVALDDEYGLRKLPIKPRTIVDVGANFGLFSLLAAHYVPGAKIHAYEPNPRVYTFAFHNLGLVDAISYPEGVGRRAGTAIIRELGESQLARTEPSEHGDIKIISLSEAIRRMGGAVDLLKMDCEGAEWEIFKDTDAFRQVSLLRMEYHLDRDRRLNDLYTAASTIGFVVNRLVPNDGFGIVWMSNSHPPRSA